MPDPAPKPARRSFTAEYRARTSQSTKRRRMGEGRVLRREGLYQLRFGNGWPNVMRRQRVSGPRCGNSHRAAPNPQGRKGSWLAPGGECQRLRHELDEVAGGGGDHGKTARSLGVHLREPGHAAATDQAMTAAYDDCGRRVPVRRACALIGRARATHYRHRKPRCSGSQQASEDAGQRSGAHRRPNARRC